MRGYRNCLRPWTNRHDYVALCKRCDIKLIVLFCTELIVLVGNYSASGISKLFILTCLSASTEFKFLRDFARNSMYLCYLLVLCYEQRILSIVRCIDGTPSRLLVMFYIDHLQQRVFENIREKLSPINNIDKLPHKTIHITCISIS